MSDPTKPPFGTVVGFDLTVQDADRVRDFYAEVIGWSPMPLDMGGYSDYFMMSPAGTPVAGVCHARGGNADLPPQWLSYVCVEDLDASIKRAVELGGEVVAGPKGTAPEARFVVIRDPAGAVLALREPDRPQDA
ncbi:VOC family protein [Solwaraspora sp. WMMD406]|uniref:VOC family protein n=1 Tax=Solwaraspora sp. WMMD406 TaxID=3016095 RepID=UPI0024162C6D|nr:VOC family protein [Solwaraspora sp. WMMD406]MDG4763962.1 VOC family protein [Solwaraspora sp. WMMD406]